MNAPADGAFMAPASGQPRRNQSMLSRLLEAARRAQIARLPLPAYCCDFDDTIVCYNQAAAELWGGAPVRCANGKLKPAHRVLAGDGAPAHASMMPSAVALRDPPPQDGVELAIARPDGTVRQIVSHPLLARGACGEALGVFCVDIDVTGRTALEAALGLAQQAKREFISALSHKEYRRDKPYGAAREADAEPTEREDPPDPQSRQPSSFMAGLIGQTAGPERISAWQPGHTPLGQMLDQALGLAAPGIAVRGQTLYAACAQRDTLLLRGPELLARGLAGALEHASRTAPDGAGLALSAAIDHDLLDMLIRDSGPADMPGAPRSAQQPASGARCPTLADAREACERLGGLLSLSGADGATPGRVRMILPVALPPRRPK
ncbi:hypothetical protein LJR289_001124 [Pseudoduganella sp. LjRoot289]|uniref:hypothetical protein n=1 Tax=Pseudoduganella sp. LjRoot289 TaxID=3342314 RepID=UPI003ED02092